MPRNPASAISSWNTIVPMWMAILFGVTVVGFQGGCGKKLDNRFLPVSGRITLDGQPLGQASISFRSKDDQFSGYSDADGRYQLKPGAAPGDYRVDISKFEANGQAILAIDPGAVGTVPATSERTKPPKQLIPPSYSDPRKTNLRFTVTPPGTDRADFELRP